MKLTKNIKRMLDALAHANAGEHLTRRQKSRVIKGTAVHAPQTVAAAPTASAAKSRAQVGLYLGSEVSVDIMQYVAQTCSRLRHGLTVLSFQSEAEVQAILAPYQEMLGSAGIELHVVELSGEPPAALSRALRRRPEVAFLVCNESGYFGHGVLSNSQRNAGIPIPVVLVAASDAGCGPLGVASTQASVRAA